MITSTLVGKLGIEYDFVSADHEVATVKENIGQKAADYDAFFILTGDGEYKEVWGMLGTVPYLTKMAERII